MALVVKNLPANAGARRDAGSIPGLERSPGGGHGNPLQYSCLGNSMDRGSWLAPVHGVSRVGNNLATNYHQQPHQMGFIPECKGHTTYKNQSI